MVKQRRKVLAGVLLVIIILLSAGTGCLASGDLVVDLAGVFSNQEEYVLEQKAADLTSEYGMDIIIVTTNDAFGKSSMEFADDYFDFEGYGVGDTRDGSLMLMDFDNREVWISTSGTAIEKINDARIEDLLDTIFDHGMTSGNYNAAAQAYLNKLDSILAGNSLTLIELIVSLLAAVGLGLVVLVGVRTRYKGKAGRPIFAYAKNSLVGFDQATDNLGRTFVTRRVIPKPSNRSGPGGSSTHTSSSGRSHGGGGRGF